MKKIIYSILICFGTVVLSSCEDTSEDISKVTHFASLELKGETAMKMKLNDTYVEPVSYTHLRAHETDSYLVCRLLLEKKKVENYNMTLKY